MYKIVVFFILILFPFSAHGIDMTVEYYLQNKDKEITLTYVAGMGAAIMTYDMELYRQNNERLWCTSLKKINVEFFTKVLDKEVKLFSKSEEWKDSYFSIPISMLLMKGLVDQYPCQKPE